jgi:hypothetical protein
VSAALRRRTITIPPGCTRPCDEGWRDALVLVRRGEIELRYAAGGRGRFVAGDIVHLAGLRPVALRATGFEPARLLAIGRRPMSFRPSPRLISTAPALR